MASIYDLKPGFQRLLRPICERLATKGVTANQVTLAALGLSLLMGALLALSGGAAWALWLLPVVLFLRMGLNAIDGMLAREHGQASRLGALLNELADLASDAALYLPFALVPGLWSGWIVAVVVLALIAEAAGVLGPMVGAARRYDGPFGKSDRAAVFGLVAALLASGWAAPELANWALPVMAALAVWTAANRVRGALAEGGT
ncbi:MAG TPA: CDP-alcohol phosphatidyltransferase family protein [Thermohalobaculum sp.]|nr:CDP-alcohol phosphatidyltransferase family protein [Thermohalobaculum sp.]